MGAFRFVVADVFTDAPLEGNQLAVFTDAREIPAAQLQPLAREMNFSETVFVYPPEADGHARIRIFTPVSELPFAGHPVLGTAFVLAGPLQLPEIRLETGKGVVPVALERDGPRIVFGRMQQPIPSVDPFDDGAELLAALGVESSELPLELYESGVGNVYVLLPDEEAVAAVEPDLAAVARVMGGVHANCTAGSGTRWKTRMFAPGDGVPEDPGHRVGGGASRAAPRPARADLLRRGDRDQPGCRDRPPEHPLRARRGVGGQCRVGRGRRLRGRRRARRVPTLGSKGHVRGQTPAMSKGDGIPGLGRAQRAARRRRARAGQGRSRHVRAAPKTRRKTACPGSDPGRGRKGRGR